MRGSDEPVDGVRAASMAEEDAAHGVRADAGETSEPVRCIPVSHEPIVERVFVAAAHLTPVIPAFYHGKFFPSTWVEKYAGSRRAPKV